MQGFPLFPEQASSVARDVDLLFLALIALSGFFSLLIATLIVYFSVRYRRGAAVNRIRDFRADNRLEFAWSAVPLAMALFVFGWASALFVRIVDAPEDALEIYVVAKQWMWYTQHPDGQREINQLHVPRGQPVRLIMTSQDIIHSFFVPAFRVKQDVLPGRYTTLWFEATRTGEFHLFCTEYCGAKHAFMVGTVTVLEPAQFQEWLSAQAIGETLPETGEGLMVQLGCSSCHLPDDTGRGPSLVGIFGQPREMQTGEIVIADENHLRESILRPQVRILAGYPEIMPSYQGRITEEQIQQIISYIKSLGQEESE